MKRLIIIAATLLTLAGVSVMTATASSASVCEPNGTGCTQAGTYPGPNALISNDYTGFKVEWTESVVQPYSSGVPLYWTAYVTYTNITSSSLTLGCPGDWVNASFVSEQMSGGSGDDGTVPAESTNCTDNPGQAVPIPPGGTFTTHATFHNVPWPGSAVSITWGDAGTSPNVYPFASKPPNPGPSIDPRLQGAINFMEKNNGSNKYSSPPNKLSLCEQAVENAYGITGVYGSAAADYDAQKAAGRLHSERNPNDSTAPAGALVFFTGANAADGHVGIAVGNGTQYWTVDAVNGYKGIHIDSLAEGEGYLGWSLAPPNWPGYSGPS